jgi:hypothetical protein
MERLQRTEDADRPHGASLDKWTAYGNEQPRICPVIREEFI